MSDINKPTAEGRELIRSWLCSKQNVDQRRDALSCAHSDLAATEKILVEWLLPPDAKPGEKIAIWAGDSLIQVEVGGVVSGDGRVQHRSATEVTIRFRGKHFEDLRT